MLLVLRYVQLLILLEEFVKDPIVKTAHLKAFQAACSAENGNDAAAQANIPLRLSLLRTNFVHDRASLQHVINLFAIFVVFFDRLSHCLIDNSNSLISHMLLILIVAQFVARIRFRDASWLHRAS